MKKLSYVLLTAMAVAACSKAQDEPVAKKIAVDPVITKATETNFETGDKIGVTITRGAETYADNACMTHDGSLFRSEVYWYSEGEQTSKFTAYYPYAATVPATFTVATNQSGTGYGASDFMAAVKDQVEPQAQVTMVFKHMLTRIVVNVDNQLGANIQSVVLKNSKTKADVNLAVPELTLASDAVAEDITCGVVTAGARYSAIVVPQTVEFQAVLNLEGKTLTKKLTSTTLKAGGQYTINMTILPGDVKIAISSEIENWTDEGVITDKVVTFHEYLDATQPYFEYDGVNYNVVKLDDGRWWMAQNLAFVPEGYTPCSDLTNVAAGVYYPIVNNAGTAAFSTSAADITANGYNYQLEVALGKAVNSIKTQAAAQALNGAQGICPPGWYVPDTSDIKNLIGKLVSPIVTKTDAPYYNGSNASIALLNADGFNVAAYGAVNIMDNTKTAASFLGAMNGYTDKMSSGYICGSSFAGITFNTDQSLKNIQFFAFMPMTNKAAASDYTINGSKMGYKMGAPVRCIRKVQE